MNDLLSNLLKILPAENIVLNANMSRFTTFKCGGNANFFVVVNSRLQLLSVLDLLKKENISYIIIGNGSNILFSDKGFDGVVIKLGEFFSSIEIQDNTMI